MTAEVRAERLADPDLTREQRVALAFEDAEDFLLEAYGELVQDRQPAQGGAR